MKKSKAQKKRIKKDPYLNYHSFLKKTKKLSNYQLSKELPFFPKRPKKLKKYEILNNILTFYDTVGISRRERAFRAYAETYEVEVVDKISLSDSLFLAKSSIVDLFKDLLKEKRGFKYILSVKVTLKRWNNATNTYDIDTIFRNSDAITVANQRFNLNTSHETLKHRLSIYSSEGSGWIIDKIENIWINISNYDPLSGSSYIPLPLKLNNSIKGLINLKNKDVECFKWCHVRFLNPQKKHSYRINKKDKKAASTLDYRGIIFL